VSEHRLAQERQRKCHHLGPSARKVDERIRRNNVPVQIPIKYFPATHLRKTSRHAAPAAVKAFEKQGIATSSRSFVYSQFSRTLPPRAFVSRKLPENNPRWKKKTAGRYNVEFIFGTQKRGESIAELMPNLINTQHV